MADETVITGIDTLLKYLTEHGETESMVLAAELGVSERTVQDWSVVLEKAKMATITYKLGKMFVSTGKKGSGTAEERQVTDIKRTIIESEITNQLAYIGKIGDRINELNKFAYSAEDIFKKNAGNIKKSVDHLDRYRSKVAEDFKEIKEKKQYVDKLSEETVTKIESLRNSADRIKNISIDNENAKMIIDDIKNKRKGVEESIKELTTNFENNVSRNRKNLNAMRNSVNEEIKALDEISKAWRDQFEDYNKKTKEYKKDAERSRRWIENKKAKIIDSISKTKSELDRVYGVSEEEFKNVNAILDKVKGGFGGFAQINEQIAEIKKGIIDIGKNKDGIEKEIQNLLMDLRKLRSTEGAKIGEKDKHEMLAKIDKESRKTSKRIQKASEDLSRLGENIEGIGGQQKEGAEKPKEAAAA